MSKHRTKGAFGRQCRYRPEPPAAAEFALPDDVKSDIAMLVRSVQWSVPSSVTGVYTQGAGVSTGGKCSFRTATGYKVLTELGIPVSVALGGMTFRAGPDEVDDIIAFCDADNYGRIIDNKLLGHFWLTRAEEIIDFSVGDWRECASYGPPIQWTAPLPDFFWAEKEQFRKKGKVPEIGRAWYTAFKGKMPDVMEKIERRLKALEQFRPRFEVLRLQERVEEARMEGATK